MKLLLRVHQPGMLTTVQRLARPGRERYGVAAGGAMDMVSLRLANALARNPPDTPALEITLTGPALEVLAHGLFAIAGADIPLTVDGRAVDNWHSFTAGPGSIIAFGRRRHGARAYLAIHGGFDTTTAGSLKRDQIVSGGATSSPRLPLIHLAASAAPNYASTPTLRVTKGPHWDRLSTSGRDTFLTREFKATLDSSRAGIRLGGTVLEFVEGASADIISEPTPLGTIQLPASGNPIILMADRPTTGGYAKIATVIAVDIPLAAQLAPGDPVRFEVITLEEAHKALARREAELRLIERIATWMKSSGPVCR